MSTIDQMERITLKDITEVVVSIIQKNCELTAIKLEVLLEKSKNMLISHIEKSKIIKILKIDPENNDKKF